MSGILDAIYIPIYLFIMAIIIVFGYYILTQLYAIPELASPTALAVLNSWKVWDTAFMMIVIGLSIVAIILAFLSPTSPVFFISEILLLIIAVFIAPIYSNAYAELANTASITPSANQFPNIAFIMGDMPIISMVIAGAIGIATFGKKYSGGLRSL